MNIRYAILPVLIIFLFVSGLTLAQSEGNVTSLANSTSFNSIAATSTSNSSAASQVNASANSLAPNLKYIWSVSGIEKDPIIVALDQNGTDLFGQAKYEPDGGDVWNGIVDGSISGNQVRLVITAQKGKTLESIKLDGAFADDALSGKFTKNSEGKITARGDFNAVWISPDISSYTPAKIETTSSQQQATTPSVQPNNTTSTTDKATAGQTTQSGGVKIGRNTKYVDVHEYAEKIGPGGDLSGVPPGMGGSGI